MEQLISAFGIDIRLIIIQVINFGLLMAVLTYFLYKPVLKVLADRRDAIAKGVKDAEEAGKALATASEEKKVIVATANKEAEAMTARAKEHAALKSAEMFAEAQRRAEQVANDAALRGAELKAAALKESEVEIAKLAVLAAEKILKQQTS